MGRRARVKTQDKPSDAGKASGRSPIENLFIKGARNSLALIRKEEGSGENKDAKPSEPKNSAIRVSRTEKTMTSVFPNGSPQAANPSFGRELSDLTKPIHGLNEKSLTETETSSRDKLGIPFPAVLLILFSAILIAISFLTGSPRPSSDDAKIATQRELERRQEWDKKVQLHRIDTGTRLNRERIQVEIDNLKTAPQLGSQDIKLNYPPITQGLPLLPESHHRRSSRDRLQQANPDEADSRIRYMMQDEQAASKWEAIARKQYIDEFITNAEKAGYKVRVSNDGIVEVLSGPAPGQMPPPPPIVLEPGPND